MNNISERDAFEAWAKKQGRRFNEGDLQNAKSWALAAWMARAAAQQDEPSTGICFFCGELMNGEHESDCPQAARAASTSANVAQGAAIAIRPDQIAEIANKYALGNPRLDALLGFVNEVIIVNGAEYAKSE